MSLGPCHSKVSEECAPEEQDPGLRRCVSLLGGSESESESPSWRPRDGATHGAIAPVTIALRVSMNVSGRWYACV